MSSSQCKLFIYEEIIINVLNRLPLKSLARFKCVSKNWRKYIAEIYRCRLQWPKPFLIGFFFVEKRLQSHFFFSYKESPLLIGTSLDESVNFIGDRVYVVASSNGFLLCNKLRSRQRIYYVYNPATKHRFELPKTPISMKDPYVGFIVKETDESVSFTIVRYVVTTPVSRNNFRFQYSLTIESFSSETNEWTANSVIEDVPFALYPSRDEISSSSAGVVNGVFFWLDNYGQWMTVYDSVKKCFWALELPERRTVIYPGYCCLGLSGGELCFASTGWTTITCWQLNSFPSRDSIWVRTFAVNVPSVVQKCQEDFGLGGGSSIDREVRNIVFHPALPHILYLQIRSMVISYDLITNNAELVYDFGEAWRKTKHYKLFSYEWPQWPRLQ
ncbi:F-box protein At5g49610-like [Solanum dulcamara]|uniref:F-box protein At5g49610-like n=1 Tax=Solanum dulcamara TaxID=45834 RepID=UPI002485CFB8|nr:F-box protein At5g49610-like [Solanum dulcamara]